MEGLSTSIFLSLSVIYLVINFVRGELSAEECTKLGFNKNNLLCSSCDQLEKYNLALLKNNCADCCQSDGDGETKTVKKYAKARLEVCGWKLGSFPQVQAFVKSDKPGKFPNFSVKYMGGQMPQIKLMEADDTVAETLSITKWDTDTIVEFLQTYLETPDPAADPGDPGDPNDIDGDEEKSPADDRENNEL